MMLRNYSFSALFALAVFRGALVWAEDAPLSDKTLVVWASLATLDQAGGSALTIEDGYGAFDGIVFAELAPRRWMPGSEMYYRTQRDQSSWPAETAGPGEVVQIAIAYRGREVSVYRNGAPYARYEMPAPPKAFGSRAIVVFGRRHLDARDADRSFAGGILDARIYPAALEREAIAALEPGRASPGPEPWAWWWFGDGELREKTGRFGRVQLFGDIRIAGGRLVLGGRGATAIVTASPEIPRAPAIWTPVPGRWSVADPVPQEVVRSTRLFRERLLADRHRPRYHFAIPEDMGLPGDPNGAFYYGGRYHLMYLYNRSGIGFSWGHISSQDLVHWRHHPDAIGPGDGDEGCFSGGAFVDEDGTAYLTYWMLWGAKGIGIAASRDRHFERWTKLDANPVIRSTEWGVTEEKGPDGKTRFYGSADPSNIWRKDGRYYMVTGNLLVLDKLGRSPDAPLEEQGDRVYLFESEDLKRWRYLGVFYERNPAWTDRSEDAMCPSFLPLPSRPDGGAPSGKHLFLFISHNKGCQYYVGEYRGHRFYPERHGRMTWVDNTYFAPEALVDSKGRQILWAWLTDNPPGEEANGWSGVYSLPRTLWLGEDGTLRMRPVEELAALRWGERSWREIPLADGETRELEGIPGDACELELDVEAGAEARVGLKVRASPDGAEETLLYYDGGTKELVFDATRSGEFGRKVVERAPFALAAGEPLRLRVFVDRSVVEIFANDRQAICRRVYPARPDSDRVALFVRGGRALFRTVRAWEMAPANPY